MSAKKTFISHRRYVPHHPPVPGSPLGVLPWVGAPSLHPKPPRKLGVPGSRAKAEDALSWEEEGGCGYPWSCAPPTPGWCGYPRPPPMSLEKCPPSSLGCNHGTGASLKPIQHFYRGAGGLLLTCESRDRDTPAPVPSEGPTAPPGLGGSGQEKGSKDTRQEEAAASEAGGRPGGSGRAVAEVGVAAVDSDPRQLLLLAVPGGGTAAGQQDAQDRCEARTARDVRDGGQWERRDRG